jgi:hypothetical protein
VDAVTADKSWQAVTQAFASAPDDLGPSADDDATADRTWQAVTQALAELAWWAGGSPTARHRRAVLTGVGIFGLTLRRTGSRIYFTDGGDAPSISAERVLTRGRGIVITRFKTCRQCDRPVPLTAYARRQRGARIDRRYCSNACRQRAYRKRTAVTR